MNTFLTDLFLAWRYLKPKRNAVSFITCISIIGVTLGVGVLIVVLAIMTGFTDEMKEKMIDTMAHIQIMDHRTGYVSNPDKITKSVQALDCKASPVVYKHALIQKGEHLVPKTVIGIRPDEKQSSIDVSKYVIVGNFSLKKGEAIVSDIIAEELNLRVGDKIILHSPAKITKMFKYEEGKGFKFNDEKAKVFLPDECIISGIFTFGKYDFDSTTIFMNIDDANDLFEMPWDSATAIYIRTKDPFHLENTLNALRKELPNLQVYSWQQMNKQFLGVLEVEKNMMFFLLIFIVLVAAFSISNTLITVVLQKTREIGLIKALGASPLTIMRTFVLQGFIVGVLGTLGGTVFGLAVVHWRNQIMHIMSVVSGHEFFPKKYYFFSELPARIVAGDLLVICIVSIVLCTVGAFLPAWRAARLDPVKALRYE
jgi:lipoprotein-releasing system permease protein